MPDKKTAQGMYNAPKVRIPQDLDKQIDDLVYDARDRATVNKTSVAERALRVYIKGKTAEQIRLDILGLLPTQEIRARNLEMLGGRELPYGGGDRGYLRAHYLLDLILFSGIPTFVKAIIENIEAFAASTALFEKNEREKSESTRLPDDIGEIEIRVRKLIDSSRRARGRVEDDKPNNRENDPFKASQR